MLCIVIAVLPNIAAWAHGVDYRVPRTMVDRGERVCVRLRRVGNSGVSRCCCSWRETVRREWMDSGWCELRKFSSYDLCVMLRNTADTLSHWRWPDVELGVLGRYYHGAVSQNLLFAEKLPSHGKRTRQVHSALRSVMGL